MLPQLKTVMRPPPDILAFSPDYSCVLVVECSGGKGMSQPEATHFRRNLLTHDLIVKAPFFMFAFFTNFYLWRREAAADESPEFTVPAMPVLREYLGAWVEHERRLGVDALKVAVHSWLRDLARLIRPPMPDCEADQMLMRSGIYAQIKSGAIQLGSDESWWS